VSKTNKTTVTGAKLRPGLGVEFVGDVAPKKPDCLKRLRVEKIAGNILRQGAESRNSLSFMKETSAPPQ
jgi:hypothetical protein